jgi:hypothetical protein
MTLLELYEVHKTAGDKLSAMLSGDGIPTLEDALGVTALIYDSLQESTSGDKGAVKVLRGALGEALEYLIVGVIHGGAMDRVVWRRALDMLAEVQ